MCMNLVWFGFMETLTQRDKKGGNVLDFLNEVM